MIIKKGDFVGRVIIPENQFIFKLGGAIALIALLIISGSVILYSEGKSFNDALFDAAVIVTHANVEGVNEAGMGVFWLMILSVMGVVINFYLVYVVLDFVLEGKFSNFMRGAKKMKSIKKMKNHYVVCGGGRVGMHVARELQASSLPVIVIEKESDLVEKIENKGITLIKGDALDEENLKKAGLENAKFLIACLDNDGDNILLGLTAKEINPHIRIAARANEEAIVKKLYHAGAEYVVLPEVVGGVQLAKAVSKED